MNAVTNLYQRALPLAHLADLGRPLLLLALRLYIASVFFKAGLTKIEDWDTTLFLFTEEYSVPVLPPALAAAMGTAGELLLPPLLALGLAGRFAALGLTVVNAMAVLSYPALFGFDCPAALQSHLWWGAGLLAVLAFGPGSLSADHWLGRARVTP
ncbi:DoxX family protein [Methyloversatilis sp.]|uniref:DoxX family protein n=1 Tax=Methyloversatilis sp. TaxID=2569862 RepID=UPI0035B02E84